MLSNKSIAKYKNPANKLYQRDEVHNIIFDWPIVFLLVFYLYRKPEADSFLAQSFLKHEMHRSNNIGNGFVHE